MLALFGAWICYMGVSFDLHNKEGDSMQQHIYQDGETFYLVDIWDNGKVTLKVKANGWHDTWSLPVEEVSR